MNTNGPTDPPGHQPQPSSSTQDNRRCHTAPSTLGPCPNSHRLHTAIVLIGSYTLCVHYAQHKPNYRPEQPEPASRPPWLYRGRPMDRPTTVARSRTHGRCPAIFHSAKRATPFGGWSYAAEEDGLGMGSHQLVSAGRRPVYVASFSAHPGPSRSCLLTTELVQYSSPFLLSN